MSDRSSRAGPVPGGVRVLLVDDHAVVREGYRRLLERASGIEVVGEADTAASAYRAYVALAPDVVVMDISLPDTSGIEALRRILARDAGAIVLAFSIHDEPIFPERAIRAGARGYVTKASAPDVLVEAVRSVARGERYLSPDAAAAAHHESAVTLDALTTRELEILRLLAQGSTLAQVADRLHVHPKTVANCQSIIRAKLGTPTPALMLRLAMRSGLVDPA